MKLMPSTHQNSLSYQSFLESMEAIRAVCRQRGEPATILLFDIDRFRSHRDHHTFIPLAGLERWFLTSVQHVLRQGDLITQMYADRFLVVLPRARSAQARQIALRCQQNLRTQPTEIDGRTIEFPISVGLAESTPGFLESEHQLIQRAELALEHSRHLGSYGIVEWSELTQTLLADQNPRHLKLDRVTHWMRRAREELRQNYLETTLALVGAVEAKDPYTRAHSMTVARYAESIGREMHLNTPMMATLRAAALLHDVGKIGVPDAILTKPGALTADEYEVVKRHPQTAIDILEHVSFVAEERPLILYHHERHDGRGYPSGLAGDQIPIGARVLAVADAIDAMLSPRSYKNAYPLERVRHEIRTGAARQFDPIVAEKALEWLDREPPETSTQTESSIPGASAVD